MNVYSVLVLMYVANCHGNKYTVEKNKKIPDFTLEQRPYRMQKVNLLWEKAKKVIIVIYRLSLSLSLSLCLAGWLAGWFLPSLSLFHTFGDLTCSWCGQLDEEWVMLLYYWA